MAMFEDHSLAVDYFAETEELGTVGDGQLDSLGVRDITRGGVQRSHLRGGRFVDSNEKDWGQFDEDASGCLVGLGAPFAHPEETQQEEIPEPNDRVVLLSKKYASSQVTFNKEDQARLEIINQKLDVNYPRYSVKDWELLEEAEALLTELSSELEQSAE